MELGEEFDGDGTIVDEGDLHICTEASGLDTGGPKNFAKFGDNAFVKRFGDGSRRGIRETRAAPAGGISIEGELRNYYYRAVNIDNGAVHLGGVVLKKADCGDTTGDIIGALNSIRVCDTEKDEIAARNLGDAFTVDRDRCFRDSL